MLRIFSQKTIFEVLASIWINLISWWLGILIIAPGFFGVKSIEEYKKLLTINLPLAIVGLMFSFSLTEVKNRS